MAINELDGGMVEIVQPENLRNIEPKKLNNFMNILFFFEESKLRP
tara:strand:- start:481 stop:615 length:135 start_codon:yes stop_codon:yes gene_type:complete